MHWPGTVYIPVFLLALATVAAWPNSTLHLTHLSPFTNYETQNYHSEKTATQTNEEASGNLVDQETDTHANEKTSNNRQPGNAFSLLRFL
jgi:hypothetical protein